VEPTREQIDEQWLLVENAASTAAHLHREGQDGTARSVIRILRDEADDLLKMLNDEVTE